MYLFIFLVSFFPITFCNDKSNIECGVLVKSTCNDKESTNWNRNNISQNLKQWITSLNRIGEMASNVNKPQSLLLRRKLRKDYTSQIVTYIGNMNCLNRTSIGPIWKTPVHALNKKLQFHNGFLYGTEDPGGKLTGKNYPFF